MNISATSITAPDVQPTLTAGTNITISGTTISAVASTPDLTNISNTNFSGVNGTFSNISSSYLYSSSNPKFRAYINQQTIPGSSPIFNIANQSVTFNIGGGYKNSGSTRGIFIAPITGYYQCSCKLRTPDSFTGSVELQWYKRATNGSTSQYETFEMWISDGDNNNRRAGMTSTFIYLVTGEGIYPRNDIGSMTNCTSSFSGFLVP